MYFERPLRGKHHKENMGNNLPREVVTLTFRIQLDGLGHALPGGQFFQCAWTKVNRR